MSKQCNDILLSMFRQSLTISQDCSQNHTMRSAAARVVLIMREEIGEEALNFASCKLSRQTKPGDQSIFCSNLCLQQTYPHKCYDGDKAR